MNLEKMMSETYTLTCVIGKTKRTDYCYSYSWDVQLPDDFPDDLKRLLKKGFGETLRDEFSVWQKTEKLPNGKTVKVDTSHEEKDEHTRAALEELKAGKRNWKSDEDEETPVSFSHIDAWLMYYDMRKKKINKRKISKTTLHAAQYEDCFAALVNRDPAIKNAENRHEQVEALLPAWIAEQEANPMGVGGIIAMQANMVSKEMAG